MYAYIYIYDSNLSALFNTVGVLPRSVPLGGGLLYFFFGLARLYTNRLCQCTGPRAILWADEKAKL